MDSHLETMVEIMSDIFLNSRFDKEELNKERPVILQEIGMVEGPKWALLKYGFIRLRLEREKAYLYSCTSDEEIQQILKTMKEINGDMVFKGL